MRSSAPGKLFLIGEYAVLDGAPAAVAALPQRALAALQENEQGMLTMVTTVKHEIPIDDALISEPLIKAVINTLDCRQALANHSLKLDTSAFFLEGGKLGLGSSAALTTALVRLMKPEANNEQILALATACHTAFQSGRGSGADIAVAALDASIRFQHNKAPVPLNLPADLFMLAIWTGVSASTRRYLSQLESWQRDNEAPFQHHMTQLKSTAETFFAHSDAEDLITIIETYNRYLNEFSQDSGLNFYNEPHIALQKEVESARCGYKPSGAGGGDFGIAFSADKNTISELAKAMKQKGRIAFFLNGNA